MPGYQSSIVVVPSLKVGVWGGIVSRLCPPLDIGLGVVGGVMVTTDVAGCMTIPCSSVWPSSHPAAASMPPPSLSLPSPNSSLQSAWPWRVLRRRCVPPELDAVRGEGGVENV